MARRPTYINKWATLAASLTALLVAGLGYLFPLYADDLKHALAVDQRGIDAVAAAANLGSYLSAPAGAAVDHLARYPRAGPRITMAVGCGIMHAGFLALAVAARGGGGQVVPSAFGCAPDLPRPPPPGPPPPGPAPPPPPPPPPPSPPPPPPSLAFAAAAAFAASNGATWLDATAMAAAVRNHARQRGPAAGVLKGAVGLSASLFTVIYAAAFAGDTLSAPRFLTFLSIAPPAIALAAAPFVNVVPFDQADEWGGSGGGGGGGGHSLTPSARFGAAGAVLAALALYSASATVVLRGPAAASLSASARATVVGGMVAVAAMLALLPAGAGGLIARPAPGQGGGDEDEEAEGGADHDGVTAALLGHEDGGGGDSDGTPSHATDDDDDPTTPTPLLPSMTLSGALRSHKFGLLFFTSFVVGGCGLTFINNAGALAASLSAPSGSAAAIVSSFSVFNCGGRLAFGALSEAAMHGSSRVPRPAFMVATAALSAAAALAAFLAPAAALPAVAAASGAAFGGQWALMAAYVADVLSVKHFALLYSMLQLAPAAGSLGLARGLAGTLYDRAAAAQGTPGYCEGRICFKLTFLICAGLGVCATVAAAALTLLSRGPYARLTDALAADDADRESLAAAAEAALAAARWHGRAARAARRASLGSPPRSAPPPEVEGASPRTPASAPLRRVTTALDRLSATERRLARRSASLRAEW